MELLKQPPAGGPENTWLKHVADDEYNGPRFSTGTRP
jgi:hypothetical protein